MSLDFRAIANYQTGKPSKIKDQEKFRQFLQEHQEKTQKQMAELWGDNLTQQNVSYAGQKLGITRKKTYGYEERDEEQRAEFINQLGEIEKLRSAIAGAGRSRIRTRIGSYPWFWFARL